MNTERINQAVEDGLIEKIRKVDVFELPYNDRINVSAELKQAYKNIDYKKVYEHITELLEQELAQKIVNKIVTEMGTDIKKLMENATIRDDLRCLLRKGVEDIIGKVK